MINILLTSDLHYDGTGKQPNPRVAQTILSNLRPDRSNIVIAAGDLTDHGYDGKVTNKCLFSCCSGNSVLTGGSNVNELKQFNDSFVQPIDANESTHLCLIHGNHDTYNGAGRYPVQDYIKKRHGNLYYTHQINDVILFFCGLYPDENICHWIQSESNKLKVTPKTPLVFIFHYNLYGNMSDWWTDAQKETFVQTVKGFNVLAVCVGHLHDTYTGMYKGLRVVSGAHPERFAQIVIGPVNGTETPVNVNFIKY